MILNLLSPLARLSDRPGRRVLLGDAEALAARGCLDLESVETPPPHLPKDASSLPR